MEYDGRLENWEFGTSLSGSMIIWGNLYEDKKHRWVDGTYIHTSKVLSPPEETIEGGIVRTRNSAYLLGRKQVMEDEEKLAIAIQALKDVIDPIAAIKAKMNKDEVLNGLMANLLAKDPQYLKSIAALALMKIGVYK